MLLQNSTHIYFIFLNVVKKSWSAIKGQRHAVKPTSYQVQTVAVNWSQPCAVWPRSFSFAQKEKKMCHFYRAGRILGQNKHNLRERKKMLS